MHQVLAIPLRLPAPAAFGLARPGPTVHKGMLSPAGGMPCSGSWADHRHAADWIRPGQAILPSQQRLLKTVASRLQSCDTAVMRLQVCRNYNFGREGSSKGQYFDTFLAPTRLNDDAVPWPEMDLSYLQLHR